MTPDNADTPARTVDGVVIYAAERTFAMGRMGPCLIVVWRGQPTAAAVSQINPQILDLVRERPRECVYINVIEHGSPSPPSPVRKLVMQGIAAAGDALPCKCAVMEGNELRLVLVRAVLTSMELLRSRQQPTKFFKTTQEMSVWVKKQLPNAIPNLDQEIVRAAEVIRKQIPA